MQIGDYNLVCNEDDGIIIKCTKNGVIEWATSIGGGDSGDYIYSIAETKQKEIIAVGLFYSKVIQKDGLKITNNGSSDGLLIKLSPSKGVPEIQELTVENSRKEFKITTDVKEIDWVKGGSISGEDNNPYETVKYGDSGTKEIIMIPDENYEIIGITVNGQEWRFEENTDGTYKMPQFDNVTEDKHIEVTYALKDNKLTINKLDSRTQEPLQGATFKLDQIEERATPEDVIGEIVDNGTEYSKADLENEILGVQGDLKDNGTYYFVQNDDGTLTPTNSKTYQTDNGGSSGKQNTTANSYVPIDLTSLEGEYVVVVNAKVSSESVDYGYATITTNTSAPTYSNTNGRFMYISGTSSSVTTAKDYTSNALTGGNTYYLHLGYRKDSSVDTGDDQVTINSIKVYKANSITYNFIDNGQGGYESNNKGVDNTTANSYIPIDLRNCTGKYNLTVNANVSSQSSDYGYATVTNSTDAPSYSSSTGRFIYIAGTDEEDTTPTDYTTVLQGGQMYYLHLGYYKNSSTSSGDDKFTVNSVEVTLNDSELYHTEVTTNSEGQAITQIPFGKYQITEIVAPEGYELLETPIEIEFRADGNHEVTISNMEKAKILVHHYLKTEEGKYTTTKVAEDELLEGKIDETYATSPHLDLEKYQLEEDAEGNHVLPENATGTYKSGTQEVTYYYEEKDIPLIVHHYIEGTETPVLLENGEQAKDEKYEGKENEEYTTNAISQEELNEKYELVEVPSNATGEYIPTETVVTYYYRVKDSAGVIVHHIDKETKEKIAPDVIIPAEGTGKYGDSYTTEVSEEIPANYEYVAKTDNWEGTMVDKLTEVTYEYKKVEPNIIDEQIEKTATQAIENPSAEIEYKIKYTTQVEDYIGKAQITIVDELPYPIDTTKSELAGGTYNEANNTITWVEVLEGIDTYTQVESGKIEVNKTIKVVYKNVDDRNTEIENRVNGRLKLLTPEKTSEGVTTTAETVIKSVVNIPVSKVWEDDSDKLGKRPTRVVFKLTGSDGSEYTKELAKPGTQGSTTTQDSTNPNKWNDIFENLPKYDVNKQEIVYTLTEINGDLTYYDASLDSTGRIVTNTSKYGKVIVHHYIMNSDGSITTTRVPDVQGQEVQDAVIEGKEGDPYTTEEATNVSEKYELVEEKLPENAEGTIEKYNEEKPQEVIYYYRLKPAKVIINYLEKDGDSDDSNNVILSEQEQIDGYVDDQYNTDTEHRKETITNNGKTYTLVEDSKNIEGTMTVEDINVTYYYLQNTKATVRYVERDPETHEIVKDLEEPYTEEGLVGDEFVTYSKKFDGYKLVESPEQTTINMTKEEQTLIYYYEPVYTGLIENHIDDKTGKILYTETHDISVGESYNIPSKEFEGYDLVKSKLPANAEGIMGEELVIVNYYYIKKAVLEVNYIDRETGKSLAEQIIDETKHEGDSYTTEEKNFTEYDMVQLEGNKEGTMVVETDEEGNITNNRTVVTYYYAKKSAGVEEHHIDIRTEEELEKPTLYEGHIGDEYNIPSKEFLSYQVVTVDEDGNNMLPINATGKMTEEKQVVTYYYYQPAKVIVHYVEKATGKELEEINPETGELQKALVIIEGQKDDEYTTTAKEFEYYTLIEKPQEGQGKMKVEITKDEEGNDVVNNTIELYYY
ncbi:MAG: MucBP domain-containing protein, partial [Clostridium sp.]|nr:MucBP domain-containing protein [Clostridium sp.]